MTTKTLKMPAVLKLCIMLTIALATITGCKKAIVPEERGSGSGMLEAKTPPPIDPPPVEAAPMPLIIGKNNSTSGGWTAKLTKLVSNGAGGYTYTTVGYVGTYHYPNEVPFWYVGMGCGEVTIPGITTNNWAGLRINTIDGNYSACPSVKFRLKTFSPVFIYSNSSLTLYY